MAETDQLESIEPDSAPSHGYVNLPSLDIGRNITVKTSETKEDPAVELAETGKDNQEESKADSTDVDEKTENTKTEVGEVVDSVANNEVEISASTKEDPGNLTHGLGSLNLKERSGSDLDASDSDIVDVLTAQDKDGDTFLHLSIINQNCQLANELIILMKVLGVSIDIPNHLQQTALHLAVLTDSVEIVKSLLQGGASICYRDHLLRSPVFIACERNNEELLKIYFLNVRLNGVMPEEFASKMLNPDVHPLNLPNADGERCLHLAVHHNNVGMARKLIENGADINLPDRKSGRTPLHLAAELGQTEMVEFLISVDNVDVNIRTYNEETALEISHMRQRQEIYALLKPLSYPVMKRRSKNEFSSC